MFSLRQAFMSILDPKVDSIVLTPLYMEYGELLELNGGIEMIEILRNFQKSEDTELTAYRTTCGSDVCSNRAYSKYFTLVGNNSKNYALLQLVSFPNEEVCIRFCHAILPTPGLELNERNGIYVDPDELPF